MSTSPQFSLSFYETAGLLLGALALGRIAQHLYLAYLGPLSHIPAYSFCALHFSGLWRAYQYMYGKGIAYALWEAHQRRDESFLRYGLDLVSVSDPEAYEEIYGGHSTNFVKTPFYDTFTSPGAHKIKALSSFATQSVAENRERRKRLSPLFNRTSIESFAPLIKSKLSAAFKSAQSVDLQDGVEKKAGEGATSIPRMYHAIALDVISALAFGKSTDATANKDFSHDYLIAFADNEGVMLKSCIPNLWALAALAPNARLFAAFARVSKIATQMLTNYEEGKTDPDLGYPILFDSMYGKDEKHHAPASKSATLAEARTFLSAGHDTVGNTTSAAIWSLCRPTPDGGKSQALQDLQAELDAAFPEADDIWQAELHDLEQLPVLNATAKEALRWSQAVPGILPRTVPSTGYRHGKVFLPPGTSVGMSTLYVHFNPTIFHSPDTFDPTRWFVPNSNHKQINHALEHHLVAFSKGSRRCLGLPLANAEILFFIALTIRLYDVHIVGHRENDLARYGAEDAAKTQAHLTRAASPAQTRYSHPDHLDRRDFFVAKWKHTVDLKLTPRM